MPPAFVLTAFVPSVPSVALFFLPKFLRAGIFTMPEYLEYRYDAGARSIMAFFMMLILGAVFSSLGGLLGAFFFKKNVSPVLPPPFTTGAGGAFPSA